MNVCMSQPILTKVLYTKKVIHDIIPLHVIGSNYNIPIVVWLQKTYPQDSPIVYVTPTPVMAINSSRYVDGNGRVYLPYLSEWTKVYKYICIIHHCMSFLHNYSLFRIKMIY